MIAPGNNTLELCPAALMRIVEMHLREHESYSKAVRVTFMKCAEKGCASVAFTFTTDTPEEAQRG